MRIMPELKKAAGMDTDELVGKPTELVKTVITNRDVILYALGGGCGLIAMTTCCHMTVM